MSLFASQNTALLIILENLQPMINYAIMYLILISWLLIGDY